MASRRALVLVACALTAVAQPATITAPTAHYYLPLPLDELAKSFIAVFDRSEPLETIRIEIALVVAVDDTVIYYDHSEDGFDGQWSSSGSPPTFSGTTLIWGDGDDSNGKPPGFSVDVLKRGDVITLPLPAEDIDVNSPPDPYFGGGDRVQATFPLSITYFAYPNFDGRNVGSYLAGAVEVFADRYWGIAHTSPIGYTDGNGDTFAYCSFFVQAGNAPLTTCYLRDKDGTLIPDPVTGQSTYALGQGETVVFNEVNRGDTVICTKPVQADLVTGEIGSNYEMRWYAVPPTTDWCESYVSPVCEQRTSFWIYNPDQSASISVKTTTSEGADATHFVSPNDALEVKCGSSIVLPSSDPYTGVRFTSASDFFVFAQIDNSGTEETYDWGFPLVCADVLSSAVVVGMGKGCRTGDCVGKSQFGNDARSPVWISCVAPCDIYIYVDKDGDGALDPVDADGCGAFWDDSAGLFERTTRSSRCASCRCLAREASTSPARRSRPSCPTRAATREFP
jgi:hypothetical protein